MTLRDALKFNFRKVTVTKQQSGTETYHYFTHNIGDVSLWIVQDENGEWYGSIFDNPSLKMYTRSSFQQLIKIVERNIS